ncbi:Plant intracellular Ras-group-related LRR protein 5 [Chlorella vulgaris]
MKRSVLSALALCLLFATSACARRDDSQPHLRRLRDAGRRLTASATSISSGGKSASASATSTPTSASTQQSATGPGSTVLGVTQVGQKIDACQRGPANSAEATLCSDIAPDTQYTCQQQAGFGKCDQSFIFRDAFCLRSCNRCGDGCVDVLPPGYTCDAASCDKDYVTAGPFCLKTCKRLPRLDDRRAAVAAAVTAGVGGTLALLFLLRRQGNQQRPRQHQFEEQQQGKAAPEQQQQQQQEGEVVEGTGTITSLEELRHLERRSAAVQLLFATPVISVKVEGRGSLTSIPAVLGKLRELRELQLCGNAIEAVPSSIGHLTLLTRLDLSGNRISELPEQIGSLKALINLDVGCNRLTALPASIGSLSCLKYLNAMSNQLTALPDTFGGLTSLYRCGLKNNQLTALPASFGQLESLVELYLTDNLLESLPAEMGNLHKLVKLQASFNRLKSLPAELGRLSNLEMLRVASCEIREVPAALRDAPKLAWMSLASNPACRAVSPRRPQLVKLSDLEMGAKLGEGASGEVFEASWMGRRVAVKIFVADRSPDGHSRDEMAISFSVSEKHLVKVVAQLAEPLGLVLEFAEGQPIAEKPNLQSLLRCRWAPDLTFQLAWLLKVALGVAAALEHMHYRGICHGDVYAHNVMASEEGHATLCDYGASFAYHKGGAVPYEAQEVRAFGLMLADMVQRLDIDFKGMDQVLKAQQDLLSLVQQCVSGPPIRRPTFGAVRRRLRDIQKQAARAGLATITPRGGLDTPRTSVTDMPSHRSMA